MKKAFYGLFSIRALKNRNLSAVIITALLFLSFGVNAQVNLAGYAQPINTASYPTHLDSLGKGGLRIVKDTIERNNITPERRASGMIALIKDSLGIGYQLQGGIANSNWVKISLNGSGFKIVQRNSSSITFLFDKGDSTTVNFSSIGGSGSTGGTDTTAYRSIQVVADSPFFYLVKTAYTKDKITFSSIGGAAGGSSTIAKDSIVGLIYNKSSWTDASDFDNNGTTLTVSGGKLHIKNPTAGTNNANLELKGNWNIEKWKVIVRFTVDSVRSATTFGLGIGITSTNTTVPVSASAFVGTSTGYNKLGIYYTYPAGGFVSQSTDTIGAAQGDRFEGSFERFGNYYEATVRNLTTGAAPVRTSYTYLTGFNTGSPLQPNTGKFSISPYGGAFSIDSINVFSRELTSPDIAAGPDSKTVGYYADNYTRWATLLKQYYHKLVVYAGAGDKSAEALSTLPSIIASHPKQYLLEMTTNDVDFNTYKANYVSFVNQLQAAGIKVLHMTFYQPGADNLQRYQWKAATFSADSIIDTYTPTKLRGAVVGDSVHLSNFGDSLVYDAILKSGKLNNISYYIPAPLPPPFASTSVAGIVSAPLDETVPQYMRGIKMFTSGIGLGNHLNGVEPYLTNPDMYPHISVLQVRPTAFLDTSAASAIWATPLKNGFNNRMAEILAFNTDYNLDRNNFQMMGMRTTGGSMLLGTGRNGTSAFMKMNVGAGLLFNNIINNNQLVLDTIVAGNTTGYVGIGTFSPVAQLHVKATEANAFRLEAPLVSAPLTDSILTWNAATGDVRKTSRSSLGGSGTVTLFSKIDGYGITSSVTNPSTTPNHTIATDTIVIVSKPFFNATAYVGTASTGANTFGLRRLNGTVDTITVSGSGGSGGGFTALTTNGTSGPATAAGNTINIPTPTATSSASFTPTRTNTLNISAASTVTGYYTKVGSIVFSSVTGTLTTSAAGAAELTLTVPTTINSSISSLPGFIAGQGQVTENSNVNTLIPTVVTVVDATHVKFRFTGTLGTTSGYNITFTYTE